MEKIAITGFGAAGYSALKALKLCYVKCRENYHKIQAKDFKK